MLHLVVCRYWKPEFGTLRRSTFLDTTLGAGQQAPDFELPDTRTAVPVRLGALLARGPAVVTFFRGGWCPYCSLQLSAYAAMMPDLAALGAGLVAISPQLPELSRSLVVQHALHFHVLSDAGSRVGRRLWPGLSTFEGVAGRPC